MDHLKGEAGRERLQPITCWAALLPKVYHRGEVVLGKRMGSLNEKKKTVLVFDDFPNLLNAPVYQFWHLTFLNLCRF